MKIKRFLKIVLLVLSFALTSLAIALMYTVIIVENNAFEYSMLIPLSMIPTGILSVIYHIKTLKHYSLNFVYKGFKDGILWIGNLLFAGAILTMTFFFLYAISRIEQENFGKELIYILIFSLITFSLGVILILEERVLYKKLNILKEQSRINRIDDISGYKDDNL